jgi:hypothetical protein
MCDRAFVRRPENFLITEEPRTLIERLLLEESRSGDLSCGRRGASVVLAVRERTIPGGSRPSSCQAVGKLSDGSYSGLRPSWTSSEALWGIKRTGSGCGSRWMLRLAKSLPSTSVTAAARALKPCGERFPPYTRNVQCFIRINTQFIRVSFPPPNTLLSKPIVFPAKPDKL